MKKHLLRRSLTLAVLAVAPFLSSCGGGGGGGDSFIGAARVSINVSPSTIDTGDRMEVVVRITDVHPNGILLKFRYPSGLSYVPNSALLLVNDEEVDIGPQKNQTKDNSSYLVYFLSQAQFDEDYRGEVVFQLAGVKSFSEGEVEVDADVNDPLINDDDEFVLDSPEFGAEDAAGVRVTQ